MSNSEKKFWTWIVVVSTLVLVAGVVVYGQRSGQGTLTVTITEMDHHRGPLSAPVILVEYSDFQCPACAYFEPIIKQVQEKYRERVTLVYREFPLRQIHPYGQLAAQAAEAADRQGKFWEFHDLLFDRQTIWPQSADVKSVMVDYARELGVNVEQFQADIDSQAVRDRINIDVASGTAANIPGTPTFFLNGKRINPQSFFDFTTAIDPLLP